MTEREQETSVATLLSGIIGDAQTLVRQEIALAREEVREELTNAKNAGIKLAIAGAALAVGGLLLVLALAQALADLLNWPAWAGYAIVGVVVAVVGYFLLSSAQKSLKEVKPVPEKTVETIKENVEWIKDRTTSDRT
ncbi:MAG TPA: phage holin family protein [Roseiflexaceae bacterium]|nr:phage holin family protein [Roseiflexaceae bacterium]